MIEIKKGAEPEGLHTLKIKAKKEGLSPEQAYEKLNKNSRLKEKVKKSLINEQRVLGRR